MDDIENRHETSAGDLIELREDLASGLKKTLDPKSSPHTVARLYLKRSVEWMLW